MPVSVTFPVFFATIVSVMVSPTAPAPPTDADFVVVMDGVDHTVGMVTLDDCPMTVGRARRPQMFPAEMVRVDPVAADAKAGVTLAPAL